MSPAPEDGRRQVECWRLLDSGPAEPAWNLALDEALLTLAAAHALPTLRLYAWRPHALSLGRFQDARDVPGDFDPGEHWVLVRRPTGGGAIYHADEITYSVVLPPSHPLTPSHPGEGYSRFHEPLLRALCDLGAPATDREGSVPEEPARPSSFFCFERRSACDVVVGGRKLLGSAQRRAATGFLQHGSLPLSGTAGAREGAVSLSEACQRLVAFAEARERIVSHFARAFSARLTAQEPSAAERALAAERVAERYGNVEWTRAGGRRRIQGGR
jgi:lipoate-protein ligase A